MTEMCARFCVINSKPVRSTGKARVSLSSTTCAPDIFLSDILYIWRDTCRRVWYCCPIDRNGMCRHISPNLINYKFHENWLSGPRLVTSVRTDRTDVTFAVPRVSATADTRDVASFHRRVSGEIVKCSHENISNQNHPCP